MLYVICGDRDLSHWGKLQMIIWNSSRTRQTEMCKALSHLANDANLAQRYDLGATVTRICQTELHKIQLI